jgi:arginine repressor
MNCPCKKVSDVKKKSATINNMFLSVDSLTRHAVLKAALGLCCFLVTNFLKYFFEKS